MQDSSPPQPLRKLSRAESASAPREMTEVALPVVHARRLPKTALVVAGMHRSGTSALARVVSLLGCDLPKTLMGGTPSNEAGHWESQAIADFNDTLLESAGSSWHDWLAFNPGWYRSPKAEEFKERAGALLAQEFGAARLFVLKDPRICRILPFWLDVFEAAGVRPAIAMPMRNPLEVAASLERRDGFDPGLGHLLWLRHVLEAEATSRGMARFYCNYDALMRRWPRLLSRASETLGIAFPRVSDRTAEEIDAFLTERLRHHREPPESVVENPMLSAWLRGAFEIFDRWAESGESAEDFPALDRIRGEFDAATPAFARLVASGQRAAQRARDLEQNLSRLSAECDDLTHAVRTAEQTLTATREQLAQAEAAFAARAKELQSTIGAAHQKLGASEQALGSTREQLAETEVRLKERFGEIATLTRLLREKEGAARWTADEAEWMRKTAAELVRGGSGWRGRLFSLLPGFLSRAWSAGQLKRKGLFDAEAYLHAHPDVAHAGTDPLGHYINHGMKEGRRLGLSKKGSEGGYT